MFERFRVGSVEGCIGFVSDEDSLFRRLGYLEFRNGYAAIAIAIASLRRCEGHLVIHLRNSWKGEARIL